MVDKIKIVTHPAITDTPKVWKGETWEVAKGVGVVVKTDGKIDIDDLPDRALNANIPDWNQFKKWFKDDAVYYTGKLYKSNSDIELGTPFVVGTSAGQWKVLTTDTVIPNVVAWNEYNPGLTKTIYVGELFYSNGDMYRCRVQNAGAQISTTSFEKMTGYKPASQHNQPTFYPNGSIVKWQGFDCIANNDVSSNTAFSWGFGSTQTWRPILSNGNIALNWKGVAPSSAVQYAYGDVIVLGSVGIAVYVCVSTNSVPFTNNGLIPPPVIHWAPLVGGTPLLLPQYVTKDDDLSVKSWDILKAYPINTVVKYTDGSSYISNAAIFAGTPFAAGTSGATWRSLGGGSVVDFVINASYPALQMVRYNGELYISNAAIPANTAFVEGTTGATWKRIGSAGGEMSDAPFANMTATDNLSVGNRLTLNIKQSRGLTVLGGGVQLRANQTYLISACLYVNGSAAAATFRWSNSIAASTTLNLIGPCNFSGATVSYTGAENGSPSQTFIYSPTVDEIIYLKRIGGTATVFEPYNSVSVVQISGTAGNLPIFQGATNAVPGKAGVIPAPLAGAEKKILFGDGNWKDPGELLSSQIDFVCGTIGTKTTGWTPVLNEVMPIYRTKNYGLDVVNGNSTSAGIVLKANQTYLFTTNVHSSGTQYGAYRWRNITTGVYIDQGELLVADSTGTSGSTGGNTGTFVYTATANDTVRLVCSRVQAYPGVSDPYSQWSVVKISGTAGAFPIFEGSTAAVVGKAGALAAAPIGTQDYVLYGDGTWKPLTSAVSSTVIVKGASSPATSSASSGNIFVDRQSRINKEGILSKVVFPNYSVAGAVVILRPVSAEASFNTGGSWTVLASYPFASGSTSLQPGYPVQIGDFVGMWIAANATMLFAANGTSNNLAWLVSGTVPASNQALVTTGGNTQAMGGFGFELTVSNATMQPTVIQPKIATGYFDNSGTSTSFTGIWASLFDGIGLSGVSSTSLTLPAGKYMIETCTPGYNNANAFMYTQIANTSGATIVRSSSSRAFTTTTTSWNYTDSPVGVTIVQNTTVGASMSIQINMSVQSSPAGGTMTFDSSGSFWKITKLS